MVKTLKKVGLVLGGVALLFPSAFIKTVSAQAPSLGDGIMCVAKGMTQNGKIYMYTSLIDDAVMSKKQHVSVTIVQPVVNIAEGELVVVDKIHNTITVDDIAAATPPEMQPVGLALTTYKGNNTFSGKTQAGTPVSFMLSNGYRTITIQHGDKKFTGVCH